MGSAQQILVAYGWDRLLCDMAGVALSNSGWRVVGSRTQISESDDVTLALVYCSRPATAVADIERVHAEFPSAKVVVVGGQITEDDLLLLIRAGSRAYVETSQSLPDLLDAVKMVRENRSPPRGRITSLVLQNIGRLTQRRDSNSDLRLTLREKQVLDLVGKGLRNKEIADCLSITANTVKNHVHHLLEKLNVRSRHEAAWTEASGNIDLLYQETGPTAHRPTY